MSKIKITERQYNKLKNNIVESALITEAANTAEEVMTVQKALNKCFKAGLVEDGICGKNTKSAIERFIGIPVMVA